MKRKYEFTGETKNHEGRTLKRIRRISDGVLGGWIEKEENLFQGGDCWVGDEAMVYDNAIVSYSAKVYDSARVFDSAQVSGSADIYGSASIFDYAQVYGSARVYDSAWVYGSAKVSGAAWVFGSAQVSGSAHVFIYTLVTGSAKVSGSAVVTRNPIVVTDALPWTVTITDNHVQIGCEQFRISEELYNNITAVGKMKKLSKEDIDNCINLVKTLLTCREAYNHAN